MLTKKLILAASISAIFMSNSANAVIGPIKITLNNEYRTGSPVIGPVATSIKLDKSDIKNTGATEYWILIDSARSPNNVADEFLYPNDSIAEGTQYFDTDLLSNGFKLKNSVAGTNSSGGTYIYVAFAENPFKITRAR